MVTGKEFLAQTKCFSENIENMFCTSDYQKMYAKIPFLEKDIIF